LSHDGILNLPNLAIDIPDFFHTIYTHPDLVCICGEKDVINEMDKVSPFDIINCKHSALFYDTTLNLGDSYVCFIIQTCSFQGKSNYFCGPRLKIPSSSGPYFEICYKLAIALQYVLESRG